MSSELFDGSSIPIVRHHHCSASGSRCSSNPSDVNRTHHWSSILQFYSVWSVLLQFGFDSGWVSQINIEY